MRLVIWSMIVLLVLLHQWDGYRDDPRLVAGMLPAAMVYHMGISLAACLLWWCATIWAWPNRVLATDPAATPPEPEESAE